MSAAGSVRLLLRCSRSVSHRWFSSIFWNVNLALDPNDEYLISRSSCRHYLSRNAAARIHQHTAGLSVRTPPRERETSTTTEHGRHPNLRHDATEDKTLMQVLYASASFPRLLEILFDFFSKDHQVKHNRNVDLTRFSNFQKVYTSSCLSQFIRFQVWKHPQPLFLIRCLFFSFIYFTFIFFLVTVWACVYLRDKLSLVYPIDWFIQIWMDCFLPVLLASLQDSSPIIQYTYKSFLLFCCLVLLFSYFLHYLHHNYLDHLVVGLEKSGCDFGHAQLLVTGLFGREHRSVSPQWEVNSRVGHQIGLYKQIIY